MSDNETFAGNTPEFVLKHRVTGAAFLILFGVLFLPWLLGTPSEASKSDLALSFQNVDEITPDEIEQELLTAVDNGEIEDVEVYVSKITPLDAIPSSNTLNQEKVVEEKVEEAKEPEKVISAPVEPTPVVEAKVEEQPKPVVKEVVKEKVEVGWIVQIGVFTDSNGVEKVVADLKSRGFDPSTTPVDTNKGPGTSVRLGPYAQRVEAAKSMATLKEKTGSDGYIKAYP